MQNKKLLIIGLLLVPVSALLAYTFITNNNFFFRPRLALAGIKEKAAVDVDLRKVDSPTKKQIRLGDADFSTLQAAITSTGSEQVVLSVPPGTHPISANFTVPGNVALKIEPGAIFSVADAATLNIKGPLEAGLYQIFSWSGTGAIRLDGSRITRIFPEWFGAKPNDDIYDCQPAIQKAVDSAGSTPFSQYGYYPTPLNFPATNVHFSGTATYYIGSQIVAQNCTYLYINNAILKAKSGFRGPAMILYDRYDAEGVTDATGKQWYFEQGGIYDANLDCNNLTGGIRVRGAVDRFRIERVQIFNNVKRGLFMYSRYRIFGQETNVPPVYGPNKNNTPYGIEGVTIRNLYVIPCATLNGDYSGDQPYVVDIEDCNELSMEDSKIFGRASLTSPPSPSNANDYGLRVMRRISGMCKANNHFYHVSVAQFKNCGTDISGLWNTAFTDCLFEDTNAMIIENNCIGVRVLGCRFCANSGYNNPIVTVSHSNYVDIDIAASSHPAEPVALNFVGAVNCRARYLQNCTVTQDLDCKDVVQYCHTNNGGIEITYSDQDGGTYGDNLQRGDLTFFKGTRRGQPAISVIDGQGSAFVKINRDGYIQGTALGTLNPARKMIWGAAAPVSGTWSQGDVCWNVKAVAGGAPGWVCVSGGVPGTWKAMNNLAP